MMKTLSALCRLFFHIIHSALIAFRLDPCPPDHMLFTNTDGMGPYHEITADLGSLTAFRRVSCHSSNFQLNHQLSVAFHDLQARLVFSIRDLRPVALTCIRVQLNIPDENQIDIVMTAQVVRLSQKIEQSCSYSELWPRLLQFPDKPISANEIPFDLQVSISSLEVCPAGTSIVKCLGRVHLHFINERWLSHDEGGLARYTHQFLAEAHSILRANVAARGLVYRPVHDLNFIHFFQGGTVCSVIQSTNSRLPSPVVIKYIV